MGDVVHGTFVSHKVSKIRWRPEQLNEAEYFVTGSFDEAVNCLTLWHYPVKESDSENYPLRQRTLKHDGDVTEIKFLLQDKIVVSSSSGCVKLIQTSNTDLKILSTWDNLHYFKTGEASPCTALACFEEDFATVGEDGRIALLTVTQTKPITVLDNTDSSSLMCVCFLKHNELLTGNIRGHMKIWDLRIIENSPKSSFMLSGDQIAATCITVHPSQKHLLLVGGENGSIYVWDLRKSNHPINILNAHKGLVCEMAFHPLQPEHLFTCSSSGELWHWDSTKNVRDYMKDENIWLNADSSKHRMEIFSLMPAVHKPINSLDVNRSRLICGCDNEANPYIVDGKSTDRFVQADNFTGVACRSQPPVKEDKIAHSGLFSSGTLSSPQTIIGKENLY